MPINVTCPTCSQVCAVADENAGAMVQCPKCRNIIQTPRANEAAPTPGTPPGPGIMDNLDQTAKHLGLDPLSRTLVFVGLGSLILMALTAFMPWMAGQVGIAVASGLMNMIISMEIIFFLVFFFFLVKKPDNFNLSLWAAAWWSSHATFWRLIEILQCSTFVNFGQYLALVASITAALAFGFVVIQRATKKNS